MPVVLDASVVLAWHFQDEASEYADRVLDRVGDEGAIVPPIWPLEVANGLAMAERRKRVAGADASRISAALAALHIDWRELSLNQALGPVLDLALQYGLTAYDAAYLELAMREGLPLATEDEDLRTAAGRAGVPLVE